MLTLCNPNGWIFYMQSNCINLKFRHKYFWVYIGVSVLAEMGVKWMAAVCLVSSDRGKRFSSYSAARHSSPQAVIGMFTQLPSALSLCRMVSGSVTSRPRSEYMFNLVRKLWERCDHDLSARSTLSPWWCRTNKVFV